MTDELGPAAINPWEIEPRVGSGYPAPYAADCAKREKRRLGDVFGLTQFGVNLVRLPPGQMSSQRHWHHREDEFVFVLRGKPTLVTDAGEQELGPGMVAGFKAGVANGHHLVNRSGEDAVFLEVGTRDPKEEADYPDIDLLLRVIDGKERWVHRDGALYKEDE